MGYHNGHPFTTNDSDNDGWSGGNCAVRWQGAWWYWNCADSHLNGLYGGPGVYGRKYNIWLRWKRNWESLKSSLMMVRPKQ